jgi:hypothetical protein
VWALRLDYDLRLLAPAWPPLVLLIVMSLLPAFAGAQRRSGLLILAPAAAMLILGVLAVNEINGLGASGWRQLRAISLTDSAALRDLALGGDFSAELDALKSRVSREDVIETYDQRLRFFYLDRVVIAAPTACSQMQGRQVLVLLESDEVRKLFGRRTSPAFWSACRSPHLEEVDERPGAYAILVNGTAPVTGGCGVAATPGLAVEFGVFRNQTAAQRVLGRVRSVGFVQAMVERVGCQAYRVVETHVPNASVGRSIVAEAGTAHLRARLVGG